MCPLKLAMAYKIIAWKYSTLGCALQRRGWMHASFMLNTGIIAEPIERTSGGGKV